MRTPVPADQLAGLAPCEIATSAPPHRWHDSLRALGTHPRDGEWVVSGPREVAAALGSPALSVNPFGGSATQADAGAAAELVSRMARFSDGEDHRRRRALLARVLPPVLVVGRIAGARTNNYLLRRASAFDIMPAARQLAPAVLARGMGLAAAEAERAALLTGVLCDALTPALRPRPVPPGAADAAARELTGLFERHLGSSDPEEAAAAISVLFQARDATAALIGTAILARVAAGPDPRSGGQRIEQVLRQDAPVQCTRRTAMTEVRIGDSTIAAGAPVWIFVAAAERGSGPPATFGSGPHACPGAAQATAIGRQAISVLEAEGWRAVSGQRIEYEPRPNIRVPARVLVARP
jgi:cytochrome P450